MSDTRTSQPAPAREERERPTIFELLAVYNRSLEDMRAWLDEAGMTHAERAGIADAWQAEMSAWFHKNGYCFACSRALERCECENPPPSE